MNYGDGSGVAALPLTGKTFALSHRYLVPGIFTITVSVSDGVATSTQTRTITVLSTIQVIQSAIVQIEQLVAANKLPAGYARALTTKLNVLLGQLNRNRPVSLPLLMQITAAGQELDGLVRSNRISATDAATIRSALARILHMLMNPPPPNIS